MHDKQTKNERCDQRKTSAKSYHRASTPNLTSDAKRLRFDAVKAVNKYLSEIGARGGRKRKDHPNKHELAKRAANARWRCKAAEKQLLDQSTPNGENKVK